MKKALPYIAIILSIIFFWVSKDLPGGMFFPGIYFAIIAFVLAIIASAIISLIFNLIFKKFKIFFYTILSLVLISLSYHFFSPELKILVDKDFRESIYLVRSNTKNSILKADKNGICYLSSWIFNHNFMKPTVIDSEGKNISNFCKGFSNNSFFAGPFRPVRIGDKTLDYVEFELLARNRSDTTFIFRDLYQIVNKNLLPTIDN